MPLCSRGGVLVCVLLYVPMYLCVCVLTLALPVCSAWASLTGPLLT